VLLWSAAIDKGLLKVAVDFLHCFLSSERHLFRA
jgi:hypothetical protein